MIQPWEHETYSYDYDGISRYCGRTYEHRFRRTYETVKDSERLLSRKGDIIKFSSAYKMPHFNDWREWFPVTEVEKERLAGRNPNVALYTGRQYGVIANRYRVKKYKVHHIYKDYGAITMLLTGSKPCKTRHYYTTKPYQMLSEFPHMKRTGNIYVRMKKPFWLDGTTWFLYDVNLSEFIAELLRKYGDTEDSRDMFLEKIKTTLESNT